VCDVRRAIAPAVNFHCNNIHQFALVRDVASAFDLNLVPEREALGRFRAAGAEAIYWPMAANPDVYTPTDTAPRWDATFAGQRYGDRTALLLALREAGVDAHAFGSGWAAGPAGAAATGGASAGADAAKLLRDTLAGRLPWRALADRRALRRLTTRHAGALHGAVGDREYVALFGASRINLGFVTLGDTHRTLRPLRQVRLREFEAPMAGGFYLTGWIDELQELYEVGREIECYRSAAELVDKARFFLRDDAARERVRRAGFGRARRDHTWTRRFEALFAELSRRKLLRRG
jgi:spore maturation protein CgeB